MKRRVHTFFILKAPFGSSLSQPTLIMPFYRVCCSLSLSGNITSSHLSLWFTVRVLSRSSSLLLTLPLVPFTVTLHRSTVVMAVPSPIFCLFCAILSTVYAGKKKKEEDDDDPGLTPLVFAIFMQWSSADRLDNRNGCLIFDSNIVQRTIERSPHRDNRYSLHSSCRCNFLFLLCWSGEYTGAQGGTYEKVSWWAQFFFSLQLWNFSTHFQITFSLFLLTLVKSIDFFVCISLTVSVERDHVGSDKHGQ